MRKIRTPINFDATLTLSLLICSRDSESSAFIEKPGGIVGNGQHMFENQARRIEGPVPMHQNPAIGNQLHREYLSSMPPAQTFHLKPLAGNAAISGPHVLKTPAHETLPTIEQLTPEHTREHSRRGGGGGGRHHDAHEHGKKEERHERKGGEHEPLIKFEPHHKKEHFHGKKLGEAGDLPTADGKLKRVNEDLMGAHYRKTEKDAKGNLVIHNYDRDQKLTMKMFTRADGVREYDHYSARDEKPLSDHSGAKKEGAVPENIDEKEAKKGQRLESKRLEYPDGHADNWTFNKDGSAKLVRELVDSKTLQQTIEYDKYGAKKNTRSVASASSIDKSETKGIMRDPSMSIIAEK